MSGKPNLLKEMGLDGQYSKQTLIELVAGGRQITASQAPKRTAKAIAHELYQQVALFK